MNYTPQEIAAKIKRFKRWYHNIDLHGVLTNPTNPSYPEVRWQLIKPYVPQDLTGKTVLDVGCNAGYFSIKMKQRGASVVGVDWYNEGIEQARFVADVLALDIEYKRQNIYQFVINNTKTFDYRPLSRCVLSPALPVVNLGLPGEDYQREALFSNR